MGRPYTHLNTMERQLIEIEMRKGSSIRTLAALLARSPSTICREIQRNSSSDGYRHRQACQFATQRKHQLRRLPLLSRPKLWRPIEANIKGYWSPDQVVGTKSTGVSRSTIYRKLEQHPELEPFLRGVNKKKRDKRRKHERIHDRKMIDERPQVVESRSRVGDFEGDTVWGKAHTKPCLATYVDRKSGYLLVGLCARRNSESLNQVSVALFRKRKVTTLTVDNGMEFGSFKKLEAALKVPVYFAHENSPWERGSNENTNGLLRQFFPKGTDFGQVTQREVARAAKLINNRPRKRLGYRTPKEVYEQECCT